MRQFSGQAKGIMVPLEGLVWIAKHPQGQAQPGQTEYPGVMPIEEGMGAVLLGIVERQGLLQAFSGLDKLSKQEQSLPLRAVGLEQEGRVLYTLRQTQKPLLQFV